MKVVAVVLNWRRPADTIACVRSLHETAPGVPVIVVDNASGDDSVEQIRAAFPGGHLVVNDANLGYAGGNNIGIHSALAQGADAVFIVNNDAIVTAGCVDLLAETMHAWGGEAPVVGPVSLRADEVATTDFYRASVDVRNMALIADGRDQRWAEPAETEVPTDYVTGSAMLIDARFIRSQGAFDERFFLVWEDVDLCLRARAWADAVIVNTRAHVLHGRSVSFGGEGSPLYWYFFVRNSFLFLDKHGRWPWKARTRRMIERRYATLSAESDTAVGRAMALGLRDGLAGRFGPAPADLFS